MRAERWEVGGVGGERERPCVLLLRSEHKEQWKSLYVIISTTRQLNILI